MGRRLVSHVHVMAEDGFSAAVFGPDDDVPGWAADQIGDHCWTDTDNADDPAEVDDDGVDDREPGAVPPRAGKGSGQPEWLSFARENGLDVADDASRADLIAACEQAGLVDSE